MSERCEVLSSRQLGYSEPTAAVVPCTRPTQAQSRSLAPPLTEDLSAMDICQGRLILFGERGAIEFPWSSG